jgi:hypothetical protein
MYNNKKWKSTLNIRKYTKRMREGRKIEKDEGRTSLFFPMREGKKRGK